MTSSESLTGEPPLGERAAHVVRWRVTGVVQGVGFRWYVAESARRLGLAGWVRNLPDGRVELAAAGTEEAIRQLGDAVRTGPPGASVTMFEVLPLTAAGDEASDDRRLPHPFTIRR